MKINYSDMSDISEVLDEFKQKYGFDKSIKQATLFGFWKKVVGRKFANNTKCVSLNDEGVLTVACKNSFISNELFMFKDEIIRKTNVYANPLGIAIVDVMFSHKIWKDEKTTLNQDLQEASPPPKIPDELLEKVELDVEDIEIIKNSIDDQAFVNDEQKVKMFNAIMKNLKEQKLKNQKNI